MTVDTVPDVDLETWIQTELPPCQVSLSPDGALRLYREAVCPEPSVTLFRVHCTRCHKAGAYGMCGEHLAAFRAEIRAFKRERCDCFYCGGLDTVEMAGV